MKKFSLAILAILAWSPSFAQLSPRDTPSVAQWKNIDLTMADLIEQGYSLVSVTTSNDGSDVRTTYFLSKAAKMVKCGEGYRPGFAWGWIVKCQELVQPYYPGKTSN
jgi:hypothetical protein